ncbi:LysE family translocator [Solibacillus sp. FSL H8-0538]|uniref:LysE family translocator n=1 Tax=Solibacillus sp. FSL H8-0538 TaxID=2921400 RepID=UPI0030F8F811
MDIVVLLSFLGTAILLTVMPGPDILFVIAQSISQNARAGVTTALGLCTGLLVHITAAVVGISAIVYSSATIFTIVKFAGAAYLIYLAIGAIRAPGSSVQFGEKPTIAYGKLYKKGIIMNILNPKVSLFFLALLPQFVRGTANIPEQMLVLGFIFLVQAFVIFSAVSLLAGRIGKLLSKNRTISNHLTKIEGAIYAVIGVSIAFSK